MMRSNPPTWGLLYWPAMIWAVILLFIPAETIAFFTNSANTLSDFSWYELGISGSITPHHPTWWASLVLWGSFVLVITAHIWFRTPS